MRSARLVCLSHMPGFLRYSHIYLHEIGDDCQMILCMVIKFEMTIVASILVTGV